jgi:hypothetical protein
MWACLQSGTQKEWVVGKTRESVVLAKRKRPFMQPLHTGNSTERAVPTLFSVSAVQVIQP